MWSTSRPANSTIETSNTRCLPFRRDQNGGRGYYWNGVLIKDRNVLMTGHLWLNAGMWLYNEFVSFGDNSQGVKPATMCPPTG
jgi:hypothetical protein